MILTRQDHKLGRIISSACSKAINTSHFVDIYFSKAMLWPGLNWLTPVIWTAHPSVLESWSQMQIPMAWVSL